MNNQEKLTKKMYKKLGITQRNIKAKRVVIEMDGKNIVITNTAITVVRVQNRNVYQIAGDEKEEVV